MEEKLLTAQDVSYEEARDLHAEWQKHEAFGAELAANKGWLEKMEQVALGLPPRGGGAGRGVPPLPL